MMLANNNQFGFSIKKIGRGIKSVAKGAAKGAVKVTKMATLLPMQLALKAAIKAAAGLCKLPQNVLAIGATAANVNPNVVPLFCQAQAARNTAQIKQLLPSVLKIAIKLGAQGMFPGLGPIMMAAKFIPGLKNFAGAGDVDLLGDALLGEVEMALAGASDVELLDALNAADDERTANYVGLGLGALAIGVGTWLAIKE